MILMPFSCNSFLFQKLDTDFDGAVSIMDFSKHRVWIAFAVQTIKVYLYGSNQYLSMSCMRVQVMYLLALRQPSYDPVRVLTVWAVTRILFAVHRMFTVTWNSQNNFLRVLISHAVQLPNLFKSVSQIIFLWYYLLRKKHQNLSSFYYCIFNNSLSVMNFGINCW